MNQLPNTFLISNDTKASSLPQYVRVRTLEDLHDEFNRPNQMTYQGGTSRNLLQDPMFNKLVSDTILSRIQFQTAINNLKMSSGMTNPKFSDSLLQSLDDLNREIVLSFCDASCGNENSLLNYCKILYQWAPFRHAVQVSFAVLLASFLTFFEDVRLHLNGKGWAAITVVTVFEPMFGGLLRKSWQRILGTFLGGSIGFGFLLFMFSLPPLDVTLRAYVAAVALVIVAFFLTYIKVSYPKYSYLFVVSLLTTIIVVLGDFESETIISTDKVIPSVVYSLAGIRLLMVLSGAIISVLVSTCVFPERASNKFPHSLGKIFIELSDFLLFINNSYFDTNINALQFRDDAYYHIDCLAKDLEKLRIMIEEASIEIFVSKEGARVVKYGPGCLKATQRMFYLMVTMVYGRMWSNELELHQRMSSHLRLIIDVTDNSMKALGKFLRQNLVEEKVGVVLKNPDILALLKQANHHCMHLFKEEQKKAHDMGLMIAYSENDVVSWNHFALTFLQMMVNYSQVLDNVVAMKIFPIK